MTGCCEQLVESYELYTDCYEPYVECREHGRQQVTYVCQHVAQSLVDGKSRGFCSSEPDAENVRPDAWCSACEAMVSRSGEWDDELEAIAGVKSLCGVCYDRARLINRSQNKK